MKLIIGVMGIGDAIFSEGIRDGTKATAKQFGWTAKVYSHRSKSAIKAFIQKHKPLKIVAVGHSMGVDTLDNVAEELPGVTFDAVVSVASAWRETFPKNVRRLFWVTGNRDWRQFEIKGGKAVERLKIDASHVTVDNSAILWQLVSKEIAMLDNIAPNKPENSSGRDGFNKVFFDKVRKSVFGGSLSQGQVDNMNRIIDAFEVDGDGRAKTLAYALATTRHEVGARMLPVREGFADTDAEARRAVRNRKYGRPTAPYNHVYYGRGYVQLTWDYNYKGSSKDAGVDLLKDPDAALNPFIAAKILIRGLLDGRWNAQGKGIAYYLPDTGEDDLMNARRTVNVTDKWRTIAGYYADFLEAVVAAREVPNAPTIPVPGDTIPAPTPEDALTLENFRKIPREQRNAMQSQMADALKLIAIVNNEEAKAVHEPHTPIVDGGGFSATEGNFNMEKTNGKAAWQSSGVVGSILALYGVFGPMFGLDVVTPDQAAEVINPIIGGIGALLSLFGRLKATTQITRAL